MKNILFVIIGVAILAKDNIDFWDGRYVLIGREPVSDSHMGLWIIIAYIAAATIFLPWTRRLSLFIFLSIVAVLQEVIELQMEGIYHGSSFPLRELPFYLGKCYTKYMRGVHGFLDGISQAVELLFSVGIAFSFICIVMAAVYAVKEGYRLYMKRYTDKR